MVGLATRFVEQQLRDVVVDGENCFSDEKIIACSTGSWA
jgi:hypothetical protein